MAPQVSLSLGQEVVKVGGSLYDWPALGSALRAWILQQQASVLWLVAGGGGMVDVLRKWHQTHCLSEETSHWLAMGGMALGAQLLRHFLPEAPILEDWPAVRSFANSSGQRPQTAILNLHPLLQQPEAGFPEHEHSWRVTSDTLAALTACHLGCSRVTLLKSALPAGKSLAQLAEAEIVDPDFTRASRALAEVRIVNLRDAQFAQHIWKRGTC